MIDGFFAALGVVFVAELGDKSQLLALTFASRYSTTTVIGGLALAAVALMALSVTTGSVLATALPERAITIAAGVVFIGFGLWNLRAEDAEVHDGAATRRGPGVLTVAGSFAIAELGDKTMLATVALAATNGVVGTWAGATLGMVGASSVAVVVGSQLGRRLPERPVQLAATALFLVFGVVLLWQGLTG